MYYARAGAAAIAAVLALSPTYAAAPTPVVNLSKSSALTGNAQATPATKAKSAYGPFDQQTMELGGGALAALILGLGALSISRRKRRREEESWQYDDQPTESVGEAEPMTLSEPVASPEPAMVAPPMSAFDWNKEPRPETASASDCEELETWIERAKCGPTPDNPSASLKKRLKRAAFFEKRDREVEAGVAAPVDADAGLPDDLQEPIDEREITAS